MIKERYDRDDFNLVLSTLQAEGVVLLPGVAGWYLGALATSDKGVAKLLSLFQETNDLQLELLLDNSSKLSFYLEEVPEVAYDLIELSEKPITLLLEGFRRLSEKLLNRSELGFRVVNEPFVLPLCTRLRQPLLVALAAKSVRRDGVHFEEIDKNIIKQVDYVTLYRQEAHDEKLLVPSIIRLSRKGEIEIIKK
ncbi:MAG TPA: Sua5/YciO/YrdC/YwlC family protein [Treponema sp.]|nr:Sua5/YciO/YrdC/YwlC family protein [Treponema sp.]